MVATQLTVGPRDHVVQFYERDHDLIAGVGAYLLDAARAGDIAIVVATPAHLAAFEAALTDGGVDVAAARSGGSLVSVDAADTLSQLLVSRGGPDPAAFDAIVGGLVRCAAGTGKQVRAYGEMVALLWDAGDVAAAIDLETLWNDLGTREAFSLYCAYPSASVSGDEHAGALHEVCHLHSAVVEEARPFPCTDDAPRAARRFVVDTLARWGRADDIQVAALAVTELATNAVLHARSDFVVGLSLRDGAIRLSVSDASSATPAPRAPGSDEPGGRGLLMVAALSNRWGTDVAGDGKVVWAELSPAVPPVGLEPTLRSF